MNTRILSSAVICVGLVASLSACGGVQGGAYTGGPGINEGGTQAPAVIQLSHPTVYAREALINDRRQEVTFLKGQLDGIDPSNFGPEIVRDLRSIGALTASVGVNFDPAVKLNWVNQKSAAQAQQQNVMSQVALDYLKLQNSMKQARIDNLTNYRGANPSAGTVPIDTAPIDPVADTPPAESAADQGAGTPAENGTEGATPPTTLDTGQGLPAGRDMQSRITAMESALTNILVNNGSGLAELSTNTNRVSSLQPEQLYRTIRAFRSEIRADIAQEELDDNHDKKGNALFRLQFMATVMPGKVKNKWGVARVRVTPPTLTDQDIDNLYRKWLIHLTKRLNKNRGSYTEANSRLVTLGESTDLFDVVRVRISQNGNEPAFTYYAAAPDGSVSQSRVEGTADNAAQMTRFWDVFGSRTEDNSFVLSEEDVEKTFKFDDADKIECKDFISPKSGATTPIEVEKHRNKYKTLNPKDALILAKSIVEAFAPALPSIQGAAYGRAGERVRAAFPNWEAVAAASSYLKTLKQVNNTHPCGTALHLKKNVTAPTDFSSALVTSSKTSNNGVSTNVGGTSSTVDGVTTITGGITNITAGNATTAMVARGTPYTYSVTPTELNQRLSTVSSAVRSMQMALDVAASFPARGVGANAGLGSLSAHAGRIDAMEQVPLVVGFAGAPNGASHFGWVFGPRRGIDTKKKELPLVQAVKPYKVTADLSVPGWWPNFNLEVESAWIANWHALNGHDVLARCVPADTQNNSIDNCHNQTMTVSASPNEGDLDALTDFLEEELLGLSQPQSRIDSVEPDTVDACAKLPATFILRGPHLWRTPTILLNGYEPSPNSVKVLPDMGGLMVTFNQNAITSGQEFDKNNPDNTLNVIQLVARNGMDTGTFKLVRNGCKRPNSGRTATTGDFSLGKPYFVSGKGITINTPKGFLQEKFDELKVAVKPKAAGLNGTWKYAASGTLQENSFITKGLTAAGDQYPDGAELEVKVMRRVNPDNPNDFKDYPLKETLLVYSEGGIKVAVSSVAKTMLPNKYTLTFPEYYARAFPELKDNKVTPYLTSTKGETLALTSTPAEISIDPTTRKAEITITPISQKEFDKECNKKGIKCKIFIGLEGTALKVGEITLPTGTVEPTPPNN